MAWTAWGLWRNLKAVRKDALMRMGWKTITGAILVGLGYAAKALAAMEPTLDPIGDGLIAVGAMLGGVGLRAAIAKK
ncbi:MAG: hypothetical protein PHQ43_12110 [Dehalococcoidales bacterium]|nr:hypothetical protein [Dehalococcoidales bacterium]